MKIKMALVLIFVLVGSGCTITPQAPIALGRSYYDKPVNIAIYQKPFPKKAKMIMPGASCLLCLAAAAMANKIVSGRVDKLSTEEMSATIENIKATLEQKGMNVHRVDLEKIMPRVPRFKAPDDSNNYPRKDYRALRKIVDADHLMVIKFDHIGVERTYSGYISTDSPQGAVTGTFYIVDLNTNQYRMFDPIHVRVPVEGEWNEPPNFPGVTTAYFKALERAKIEINKALEAQGPVDVAGDDI